MPLTVNVGISRKASATRPRDERSTRSPPEVLPDILRLPRERRMLGDPPCERLVGGQQFGADLPVVEHAIEKLTFCLREREEDRKSVV